MEATTPTSLAHVFTIEDAAVSGFIVLYGTLLALGFIICVIFAIAMFRGRKVLSQWPFYRVAHSLLCLDLIYLIYQLAFVFPSMVPADTANATVDINATLADADNWYNSTFVRALLSVVGFLPAKGVLFLTLLMTLNRFSVFVMPSMQVIFTKRNVHISIIACWTVVWFLCALSVLVRPTQRFNQSTLRFEDSGEVILIAPLLRKILDYSDNIVPFVTLAIYAIIYWSIRRKRVSGSSSTSLFVKQPRAGDTDDKKMLLQAIIICAFLQLYNIATIVAIIFDTRGIWNYILNMSILILSVTNHSIHSTIFILTNSTLRVEMIDDTVVGTVAEVFLWSYFAILLAGTAMTLIFLLALVRGRKILAQWPFYKIVWSMTWMDAIYLAVQLCWQFPQIAADDDGPDGTEANIEQPKNNFSAANFILNVLSYIPPKGILYFSLLMALNRLAVFLNSPSSVNTISDYVIPFVIVGIYIVVYVVICKKRKIIGPRPTNQTSACSSTPDERKMLIESIIVTFFLQLDNTTRVLNVVYDGSGWLEYLVNILDLICTIINCARDDLSISQSYDSQFSSAPNNRRY